MKKALTVLKRILAVSLCLPLASAGMLAVVAAPADGDGITWFSLENLVSTEMNENEMVFTVSVNGKNQKFYLSFPSGGGIRFCSESKGFFTPESTAKIKYKSSGDTATLDAGTGITVKVNTKKPWSITVFDSNGKAVTEYSGKSMYYGYKNGAVYRVCVENTLSKGEVIYGLGERFNKFNRVGIKTSMVNTDAWSKEDTSYKNIPVIHSSKGYTFFFNSASEAVADIGETAKDKYSYNVRGQKFDFYVFAGLPLERIGNYTSLTGTPMQLPKWAFRFMPGATTIGWELNGDAYKSLTDTVEGYASYGITDIGALFGEDAFAKIDSAYTYLNSKNIHPLAWNAPFQASDMNYLQKLLPECSADAKDYEMPKFRRASDLNSYANIDTVDFSHPNAVKLIKSLWQDKVNLGLRGLMIDYGEYIGTANDGYSYAGMHTYEAHNFNSYYYAKAYYDAFNEMLGKGNWLTYERSSAPGAQKYAANFAGDQTSDFDGMNRALRGMLSFTTCGFSTYGSDIGGLAGGGKGTLYHRWLQLATFSPLMRAHGSDGTEVPWEQGNIDIFLNHYWFRESILDKIYSSSIIANTTGLPMVRAMAVAFPDDERLLANEDQYIFCDDFLVCPMAKSGYTRDVIMPAGSWTSLYSGKVYEGGKTYTVDAPQEYSPVFLNAGSVIPVSISADTLSLFSSKQNGNSLKALLVTAPDYTRKSRFYDENKNLTFYNNEEKDDCFTVSADKQIDSKYVLLQGVNAAEIKVDGKKLEKSGTLPDGSKDCYFVDNEVRTVVCIADGKFGKLTVKKGEAKKDIAAGKSVDGTSGGKGSYSSSFGPEKLTDGDKDSYFVIKGSAAEAVIDLGAKKTVDKVILKWKENKAQSYNVSLSDDGKTWKNTVKVDARADFGIDEVLFNSAKSRYVKLSDFKLVSSAVSQAYECNVYGDETVNDSASDGNGGNSKKGDGKKSGNIKSDGDNGSAENNEKNDAEKIYEKSDSPDKSAKAKSKIPLWAYITGGVALLAAGSGTGLYFFLKRRRKTAEAN